MTFSSNSGSFETLNPFVRCGFTPASAHMRPTLDGEMPTSSAISARLQWVALGGVSCTVLAISFVSKGNGGTLEGRVLSRFRPATPASRYRACQRQTVGFDVHARRMISKVPCLSAVASTISARQTSLRAVLRLMIKVQSSERSAGTRYRQMSLRLITPFITLGPQWKSYVMWGTLNVPSRTFALTNGVCHCSPRWLLCAS